MEANIKTLARADVPDQIWDLVVDSSSGSSFLHKWWVLEAQQTWPGREDRSFIILNNEDVPLGIFPLILVNGTAMKFIRRKRFESYGGILINSAGIENDENKTMAFAINAARKKMISDNADYIRFVVPDIEMNIAIQRRLERFTDLGVSVSNRETWVVHLDKSESELWANVDGKQRNIIRKAIRNKVSIRPATEKDLDVYYEMHIQTCSKNGLSPHPREYFSLIWNHFYPRNQAFILIAELEGKPIAAQTFSMNNGTATYWTGASLESAAKNGANAYLQWEAIKHFREIDYDFFENGWKSDDVGSKSASISKFKGSFGGIPHPLYCFELLNMSLLSRSFNTLTKLLHVIKRIRNRRMES